MKAIETLNFIEELQKLYLQNRQEQYSIVFQLCETIKNIKAKEERNIPYHLNIIDLLWADENAHSRILTHLLKQNDKGRFEILESFIQFLFTRNDNFNFEISVPKVYFNNKNIDILIKDEHFAIIIENKIHYAIDQSEQLKRYINEVKGMGYSEEQIYILYLPRDEYKTVEDQSWGEYKELFEGRFINFTYRDDVLPWLKNEILPNIKIKDIYLKSALEQYIDHLEGLFSIRKNQERMNKKLREEISEKLGLEHSSILNIKILDEKLKEINEVRNHLLSIKQENEALFWNEMENKLIQAFPNSEIVKVIENVRYPRMGIKIDWNNIPVQILFEKENSTGHLYFGIRINDGKDTKNNEIQNKATEFSLGCKKSSWWYSYTYTTYEKAYENLENLIKKVQEYLSTK